MTRAQIRELYNSEVGLDLHALDADCAQLRGAGTVVTEALRLQRAQIAALSAAWTGPGAQSAVAFLQRHCDAANVVAAEVRAAAQRCESLRDNLWYLVDSKVATVVAIDDRTLAQRPAWLAAVATVTTGAGDRAAAQELVNQQVKPYVYNDIRHDWLTAVRSTQAGVTASYDMVTDRLASAPGAVFEIPGDLGPTSAPSRPIPPTAALPATAVTPAASGLPADPVAGRGPSTTPPSAFTAIPANATAPPVPSSPLAQPDWGMGPGGPSGVPGGEGGVSGMSGSAGELGGLGSLATRLVQAMSGLLGSPGDQPADDPFDDDTDEPISSANATSPKNPKSRSALSLRLQLSSRRQVRRPRHRPSPTGTVARAAAGRVTGRRASRRSAGCRIAGERARAESTAGGSTPCEIAANELPQAGQ